MNRDATQPLSATLPQPGRTAEAPSRHDEPCLDPRELTPGELQAVAGGPSIESNST